MTFSTAEKSFEASYRKLHTMRSVIIIMIGLCMPLLSFGQKGLSLGVQSNNGIGRLSIESQPTSSVIESRPGFVTGASLYLQWNFTENLGLRVQADGLFQEMAISISEGGNFGSTIGRSYAQGAFNLQANVSFPLNHAKTLRIEAFAGLGIRSSETGGGGCSAGVGGNFQQGDTFATANINASRVIGNGTQPEVLGGIRFVQQVNQNEKHPISLTFGLGYRQALSPLSTIRGISYTEDVELIQDPNFGFTRFPVEGILGNCEEVFDTRMEEAYVVQHIGRQFEMQVGLKFGL